MCSRSGEVRAAGASAEGHIWGDREERLGWVLAWLQARWQEPGRWPLEVGVVLREAAGRSLALTPDLVIIR